MLDETRLLTDRLEISPAAREKHGDPTSWAFVESLSSEFNHLGMQHRETWRDAAGEPFEVLYVGLGFIERAACADTDGDGAMEELCYAAEPHHRTVLDPQRVVISAAARARHGDPRQWSFVAVLSVQPRALTPRRVERWNDASGQPFEIAYFGPGTYAAALDSDGEDALDRLHEIPEACEGCGVCCSTRGATDVYAHVTSSDYQRMDERARQFVRTLEDGAQFLRMVDRHCAALVREHGKYLCSIHPVRPDVCRALPHGSDGCHAHIKSKKHLPVFQLAFGPLDEG